MKKIIVTTLILCAIVLTTAAQKNHIVEFPFYTTKNTRKFDITKITTDKEHTALEVFFYSTEWVKIAKTSILTGSNSGKKYRLLRSEGIEIEQRTTLPECGYMKAILYFEPLDPSELSFDFSEGENVSGGWEINGISLTPYNLADIIKKDKKLGEKTISPFSSEYCCDSIMVELDIKNVDRVIRFYYEANYSDQETTFSNGKHSFAIPVFNTISIVAILPYGNDLHQIIASPGDTVRISYDGSSRQVNIITADNEMQRCIDEYIRYDRENGIYDSPVTPFLSPQQIFYNEISGTLKRKLMRLQNYIAAHPDFNEKAAYFLRTELKADALRSILQYRFNIKKQPQTQFSDEMMALIKELFTDIPSPFTISSNCKTIFRDYIGYKEDLANNGLRIKLTLNASKAMLALNSCDKIKLSKKDIRAIERHDYLQSLNLATALKMVDDTIKAAAELRDTTKVIKRYNALCSKYLGGLSATDADNYAQGYDFIKIREEIMSMSLAENDKKFAVMELNYENLANDSKSLNDTVMQMAMVGMEDFLPVRAFVEQNDYLRRLEAEELEIKYLQNYADITPETLVADSLLAAILEPHRGKVVYADFWGTWCSPCKEQMSYMPAVKEALEGKDVVYIYFADNSPEDVRQTIVKKYGIYGENTFHYNLPFDQHQSLKTLLNIKEFPTYLLFDKKGRLVNRVPPTPKQKDLLLNEIKRYLDEE